MAPVTVARAAVHVATRATRASVPLLLTRACLSMVSSVTITGRAPADSATAMAPTRETSVKITW